MEISLIQGELSEAQKLCLASLKIKNLKYIAIAPKL